MIADDSPDLAALPVGFWRQRPPQIAMITVRSLRGERQQFQALRLLIVLVDEAPDPGFAALVDVDVDGVSGQRQSLAADVIGAVRVEDVKNAGRDRLQLLERRHHLGSVDRDLELAAADLLDVLLKHQAVDIRGPVVLGPARQQLKRLCARLRPSYRKAAECRRQQSFAPLASAVALAASSPPAAFRFRESHLASVPHMTASRLTSRAALWRCPRPGASP